MDNITFGSTFEVKNPKAFTHKAGKQTVRVIKSFSNLASNIAGKEDQFILESNAEFANGPMFPASIKYIPSELTKGMKETVGTISGKRFWGTEIADFMRNTQAEWLEKNSK